MFLFITSDVRNAMLCLFNAGTQKFIFSEVNVLMIVTLLISNL